MYRFINKSFISIKKPLYFLLYYIAINLLSFTDAYAQSAANPPNNTDGSAANPPTDTGGTAVNPPNTQGSGQLTNPLNSTSIIDFLDAILDIILIFALPIIVFFIIYAGFLFVTARGNEQQITTARRALTWAVVGGVIVLGANALVEVIQGTVNAI